MPQECSDPPGKKEGGSRYFSLVLMLLLLLGFTPLGFSKVWIERSSQSWLCCEEPGSWARVAHGAQLTWGRGRVNSHQNERLGGEGKPGAQSGRWASQATSRPRSLLLESQGFLLSRKVLSFTQGFKSGKPLGTPEIRKAGKRWGRSRGRRGEAGW